MSPWNVTKSRQIKIGDFWWHFIIGDIMAQKCHQNVTKSDMEDSKIKFLKKKILWQNLPLSSKNGRFCHPKGCQHKKVDKNEKKNFCEKTFHYHPRMEGFVTQKGRQRKKVDKFWKKKISKKVDKMFHYSHIFWNSSSSEEIMPPGVNGERIGARVRNYGLRSPWPLWK